MDDKVLGDIYQYWLPPTLTFIRLPPLLWSRVRHDLGEYLVERQTSGVTVLGLYHRCCRSRCSMNGCVHYQPSRLKNRHEITTYQLLQNIA